MKKKFTKFHKISILLLVIIFIISSYAPIFAENKALYRQPYGTDLKRSVDFDYGDKHPGPDFKYPDIADVGGLQMDPQPEFVEIFLNRPVYKVKQGQKITFTINAKNKHPDMVYTFRRIIYHDNGWPWALRQDDHGDEEILYQGKSNTFTYEFDKINTGNDAYAGGYDIEFTLDIPKIGLYYGSDAIHAEFIVEGNQMTDPSFMRQPKSAEYKFMEEPRSLVGMIECLRPGILNYKWFKNTKRSYEGAEQIEGANSAEFKPPTDKAGKTYYFCQVSQDLKLPWSGETLHSNSVNSDFAEITVHEPDIKLEGEGTRESPFLIKDAASLETIRDSVNNGNTLEGLNFKFTNDVELPKDWVPIGSTTPEYTWQNPGNGKYFRPFSGIIDGDGHKLTVPKGEKPLFNRVRKAKVSNLKIYGEDIDGYGLVNQYDVDYGPTGKYTDIYGTGVPFTIVIDNVTILSGTHIRESGFIGGFASGGNKVTIRNSTVEEGVTLGKPGDIQPRGSFAGLFNGEIINCQSGATVYGVNDVGGFVGRKGQSMGSCDILNSTFTGKVEASGDRIGGILGSGYEDETAPNTPVAVISNCLVTGSVKGNSRVGGIYGSEGGIVDCWGNGEGGVTNSAFWGKISATGKEVGAIAGYFNSYNKFQSIEGNYFDKECGAKDGVGKIKHIIYDDDKDYAKHGIKKGSFKVEEACKPVNKDALKNGEVAELLNKGKRSFKNWKQGKLYPVLSKDRVAYKMTVDDYKKEYKTGEEFADIKTHIIIHYTDGNDIDFDGMKDWVNYTGFDNQKRGIQTITVQDPDTGLSTTFDVVVKKADPKPIKVKFSLFGDKVHGDEGPRHIHGGNGAGLEEWIPEETVEIDENYTVWDLVKKEFGEHTGFSAENESGNYISAITKSGERLAEFSNGANSGWMYTLNGIYSDLGVGQQFLNDGDIVVLHYTDDYTKEKNHPTEKPDKAAARVTKLIKKIPEAGNLKLTDDQIVNEARKAFEQIADEAKALIKAEDKKKLDEAISTLAKLKKDANKDLSGIYKNAGAKIIKLAKEKGISAVQSVGGEWVIVGLARSEQLPDSIKNEYLKKLSEIVKSKSDSKLHEKKGTDNSKAVIALTSIGVDPRNYEGKNLLEPLSDLDYISYQGINGPIWALIALDSHKYDIPKAPAGKTQTTRENLREKILEAQLSDGGWDFSMTKADPDMTAMAIQALAPYYKKDEKVKKAIDKGLKVLSEIQDKRDATFASWGYTNAESIAQVIVALTSMGINPITDKNFVKNNLSTLDALTTFYDKDTSMFKHTWNLKAEDSANGMTLEQAYYALVSYSRLLKGQTSLYDMSDVELKKIESTEPAKPGKPDDQKEEQHKPDDNKSDEKIPGTISNTLPSVPGVVNNGNKPKQPVGQSKTISKKTEKVGSAEVIKMIEKMVTDKLPETKVAYTDEQYKQIVETYKRYAGLSDAEKKKVKDDKNYSNFEEIIKKAADFNHYDEKSGVDLRTNDESKLPWYVKAVVKPISLSKAENDKILKAIGKDVKPFDFYDITLMNTLDNKEWKPTKPLEVIMNKPDLGEFKNCVVAHFGDDGKFDIIDCSVDGDRVKYIADSFSKYGIVGTKEDVAGLLDTKKADSNYTTWLIAGVGLLIVLSGLVYFVIRRKSGSR